MGQKEKNTVLMDQHGRNVQHGPISNRAVTIKQRRVRIAYRSLNVDVFMILASNFSGVSKS